jgi:DNA polymerase III delta prime subunit
MRQVTTRPNGKQYQPVHGLQIAKTIKNRVASVNHQIANLRPPKGFERYTSLDFSDITVTYEGVERFVASVATGELRGLILTGPPGVGKTTTVTKMLAKHATKSYKVVAGHMSVVELYIELYRHQDQGEILVLDDVDSAFKSVEGLNVVKAAADSVPQRRISWATNNPMLRAWGIPKVFDYNGGIILISNETEDKGRKGKLARHIDAISDRLNTIRLGKNCIDEQFHQLCYQVVHGGLLNSKGLSPQQQCELLDYIAGRLDKMEKVSLRTATKIADLMLIEPDHWKPMANLSLLTDSDI